MRLYDLKHTNFFKFTGQTRKNKLRHLKTAEFCIQRQTIESENNTLASYKVVQLIAKDKGRFTDGDFVKKCMIAVIETVCSEKIKLYLDTSFSAKTITRRIREISENVKYNQKDCFGDLQFFAIAIDENTDTTDTADLAVFVSGVYEDFHVVEILFNRFL